MSEPTIADLIRSAMPLHQAGRLGEAEAIYRRVLERDAQQFDALHLLGLIAHQQGWHGEAADLVGRAVKIHETEPIFWFNFGNILGAAGRDGEAVTAYRRAVELNRAYLEAQTNLANTLERLNRIEEAVLVYESLCKLLSGDAEAHFRLGWAFHRLGHLGKAADAYRRAIGIVPNHVQANHNLAAALGDLGRTDESIAIYRRVLAIDPAADAKFYTNMLLTLQYSDSISPEEIFAEHLRWGEKFADSLTPVARMMRAHQRLRIGYVSSDFRRHPVGTFFSPLLINHDRARFEITCYSGVGKSDEVTERLKSAAEHWREIGGVGDEALVELIEKDEIDLLIDLAGHTADHRLLAFARRPAPVQATYLGYPGTSGIKGMDYRITDALADPPGMTERLHTEKLVRLEHCFLCYQASSEAPEVNELPSLSAGYITFGSFNHAGKISSATVGMWAAVLNAVADSRLALKALGLMDEDTQKRLLGEFAGHGIDARRIIFLPVEQSYRQHLAKYHLIDIGLDTFPYHGTTTTCEAMWMGVPVISRIGSSHVSRVGLSLLANAGLTELAADSTEGFVDVAMTLAGDRQRLVHLRKTLRQQMQSSALMDAPAFARDFERLCRQMCATTSSSHT